MSKVNFVSEFNMFMRYARDNSLSLRERMLWIALFYVANDRATYNEQTGDYDWPDGFIQVSNNELNLYCCLDKRSIVTLRNTLKQRGLIDFREGKKNKRNPAYQLNYLSVNVGYKIVPNPPTNNTTNDDTNIVPNDAPNDDTNPVPSLSPFSKEYINTGLGINQIPPDDEEDGEEDLYANTYARVSEELKAAYRYNFGADPTASELDAMTRHIISCSLEKLASNVIYVTAQANPKNRIGYLREVCNTWRYEWIRTEEDLYAYLSLQSLGRTLYGDELFKKEDAEREARKAKYTKEAESA